jgi:hypothetical protein
MTGTLSALEYRTMDSTKCLLYDAGLLEEMIGKMKMHK